MGHEKENLSGYLDAALPEADRRRVEGHLAGCAGCRAELDELRAVSRMVRDLPQKPLPAGFLRRLDDRRQREEAPRGVRAAFSPRNLAWAVCGATVMFVAYEGLRPKERIPLPPPAPPSRFAKLAAPAAPKRFGGSAVGEPAAAPPVYSNEAQQRNFEAQKTSMGIKKIFPHSLAEQNFLAAIRGAAPGASADLKKLAAAPAPAPVPGATPALLGVRSAAKPRTPPAEALVPPEDFSRGGFVAGPARKGLGEPLPSPEEAGRAVYSMEEMTLLWRDRSLPAPLPRVDFSRQMLVVVLGQARIESVAAVSGRLLVRYRGLSAPPAQGQRWRVVSRSELPVAFEKLP